MVEMSLHEAQLFRMLEGFFGRDRVIWNMSVRTVCGGEYPTVAGESDDTTARWAGVAGCLFTVVDEDDIPKMVVEFAQGLSHTIDVSMLDRQQKLPDLLERCGIRYIMLTQDEFEEILDPHSSLDLVSVLKDRFGIHDDGGDVHDGE
jgi:hypothetical protein